MLRSRKVIIFSVFLVLFFLFQICIYFGIYPATFSWPDYLAGLGQGLFVFLSPESQKLIRINLYSYTLTTFENDRLVRKYEIAAIGHPKISPTPIGSFKIFQKQEKPFSNLSKVWMPWSMRFYKKYYIHEIPYYPSGERVKTDYSLGCLRIPLEQAEELYQWAELGTRVEIYEAKLVKAATESSIYQLLKNGFKKHIINPEVFASYGYQWKDVVVIPDEEIRAYSDIDLIKGEGDYKVYKIEDGIKRWIKTEEAFERLGYDWSKIILMNATELSVYQIGEPIK